MENKDPIHQLSEKQLELYALWSDKKLKELLDENDVTVEDLKDYGYHLVFESRGAGEERRVFLAKTVGVREISTRAFFSQQAYEKITDKEGTKTESEKEPVEEGDEHQPE